jgi:DNA topoisomerase I
MAAQALAASAEYSSAAQARRNVVKAVEQVAKRLGNTKAVCRKSYIHPAIFDCYMDGITVTPRGPAARSVAALSPEEAAVVGLLQRRLLKTA